MLKYVFKYIKYVYLNTCFSLFEIVLQSLYLSTLGGDTTTTKTNRILKHTVTNEFAKNFNFAGQKNKKESFGKLRLKTMIIRNKYYYY
jgi:hypothetical protein